MLADLDNLAESMAAIAQRIEEQRAPFAAQLECLCSIPGVKPVGAAGILAESGTR